MVSYGNYNLKKKRKGKLILKVVIGAVIVICAAVFIIGIIAGSGGEDTERISSAIEENTQLKLQIGELNEEIAKLKEENETLKTELESRPTPVPENTAAPETASPMPTESSLISPR